METMKKFNLARNHVKLAIVLMAMTLLLTSAAAKGRFGGGSRGIGGGSSGIQPRAQSTPYYPYFPYIPTFRRSSSNTTHHKSNGSALGAWSTATMISLAVILYMI